MLDVQMENFFEKQALFAMMQCKFLYFQNFFQKIFPIVSHLTIFEAHNNRQVEGASDSN